MCLCRHCDSASSFYSLLFEIYVLSLFALYPVVICTLYPVYLNSISCLYLYCISCPYRHYISYPYRHSISCLFELSVLSLFTHIYIYFICTLYPVAVCTIYPVWGVRRIIQNNFQASVCPPVCETLGFRMKQTKRKVRVDSVDIMHTSFLVCPRHFTFFSLTRNMIIVTLRYSSFTT